ncbi:hypothetical protein [Nonlabens sp. SY33080]|uniref:hypothetical protein n=1 Tax=Nonlabens sp. SY33080 TaxID=2719911 RepID=UPI00142892F5|nr:hypothetical protein [Nonlabens sp. SY33080]
MKNLFLTAGAMLIAGAAFAQTPSMVQVPTQQGSPTATATVGGNYSNINQKAVGSNALVEQQGTANASFIDQTGSDQSNKNEVYVKQWGNVQPSISGHLNYSDITQNGAGNDFTALQQGDENQNFGTQAGFDNTVMVKQGANSAQHAEHNIAISDQDGNENSAEIEQYYDNNVATIKQRNDQTAGIGNQSYQLQTANPNASAGHTAIGEQWGDDNKLVQMQDSGSPASGGGNYAESMQGSAANSATNAFAQQKQSGDLNQAYASQLGANNTLFQEQLGSGNKAVASQADNPVNGSNLYAEQYQDGTDNEARSKQNGRNNEAYQEQYGLMNYSTIEQRGGVNPNDGNVALSIQDGTLNDSRIKQQARGNTAFADQTGDGQMSVINQNLTSNSSPNGHGYNSATVIQRNANVSLAPQVQRAGATRARF